jgi:hypothetical protein
MPRALAQSTSPWSRPAAGCLRIPTGSRVGSSPSMPVWPLNSTLAGLLTVVPSRPAPNRKTLLPWLAGSSLPAFFRSPHGHVSPLSLPGAHLS